MNRATSNDNIRGKAYWATENRKYVEPHFRLHKVAKILTELSEGKDCDLLDVGCGPAALAKALPSNLHYYGIDIALYEPQPNLLEIDVLQNEISFHGRTFDFVVSLGLFEYVATQQRQKLAEIRKITKANGYFVMSYVNFDHINKRIWPKYNNIQSSSVIRQDISTFFEIRRVFPTFHHWVGAIPRFRLIRAAQANLYFQLPVVSHLFADEFIYICTPR